LAGLNFGRPAGCHPAICQAGMVAGRHADRPAG
jgi:hypothetical protein